MTREEIQTAMREHFDTRVYDILRLCGGVGDEKDTHTYLVGGIVRDLLLKKPSLDIDITVEGDGLGYSRALAEKVKGEVKTYDAFGTATVSSGDGIRLDIASARRETYEEPAALPKVSVGNLRDDMFRRDFTINSMAISLRGDSFGELVDFFSGERDLARGTVRILHNRSFEDDPTRIMRAVRFEVRFGFTMDARTEQSLKDALSEGMLERLSPERKRYEIELLFSEDRPDLVLDRLRELKVLGHVAQGIKPPDKRLAERIGQSIEELGGRLRPKQWLVYLIALADSLPFGEAVNLGKILSLKKNEVQKIIQMKMAKPEVAELEKEEEVKPSRAYRILRGLPAEALVYLYSVQKEETSRRRFREFVEKHRGKRTLMTGEDIKRLGIMEGPLYKMILDRVLDARIDGEVESLEDEMGLARKIVEGS